jgi:hypothetical protein
VSMLNADRAKDPEYGARKLAAGQTITLADQVRNPALCNTPSGNWPTPTCSDAFTDKLKSDQQKEGSMHSVNLSQAVKMWPTPSAMDWNMPENREQFDKRQAKWKAKGVNMQLPLKTIVYMDNPAGGKLNPDFVEWLMHWPRNWTRLEPMRTIDYLSWLMGSNHGTKKGNTKEVRELPNSNEAQVVRNAAGGHGDIQSEAVLLPELRQYQEGSEVLQSQGAEIPEGTLRNMRIGKPQAGAPQGQEHGQQFSGEHTDAMRKLPHEVALEGGEGIQAEEVPAELRRLWEGHYTGPLRNAQDTIEEVWERATSEEKDWIRVAAIRGVWNSEWPGVPRVAVGISNRADRLKAIGNGQVPAAASLAWNTLYQRIEARLSA